MVGIAVKQVLLIWVIVGEAITTENCGCICAHGPPTVELSGHNVSEIAYKGGGKLGNGERQIEREAAKMVGLKRMIRRRSSLRYYVVGFVAEKVHCHCPLPSKHLARLTPKRFLDLHQFVNKKAIEEERARLGYFADMAEFKQHGGKIGVANKVIIPAMAAVKFPDLEVSFSDGKTMKLPIRVSDLAVGSDKSSVPKASLVCLSFRASSQATPTIYVLHCFWFTPFPLPLEMINSWSAPFLEAFRKSKGVHLYQGSIMVDVGVAWSSLWPSFHTWVAAANCSHHPEIMAHLGLCGWQREIPLFIPEPTFWDFQSSFEI
ncbi:hypothetical protein V8G54_032323 [Vigna mungo]|uniref:Uncharacterized protein n=1 Tax=Vigna mungo TaxID=3915 RepID=A0AAQ3RIQ7_VIGMU